jgi:hypothetical protein
MIPSDQFLSPYVSTTQAALHVMTLRLMAGSNLKLPLLDLELLMYMHAPL